MMIWSKETASKSCDKNSSHCSLQNQKHHAPMLLNSSSKNSQKMQCKQYINGKKKYGIDNTKDQKRKPPSPVLCSIPSNGKKTKYGSPAQNDRVDSCSISRQDYSHLSDAQDSAKQPNYLMNEESFHIHVRDLMDDSYSYGIATSIKDKLKEEDMEFADSRKKFLPPRGNHLPRPFIPIGPRFQAEVPKWEASTNINQYDNDNCLKWLGTQIWPIPSLSRNNAKNLGKGMPDSSSGENLESVDRVKTHGEVRECFK
ncbi:hypothetical protein RYX36_032644 [Vicia faba]